MSALTGLDIPFGAVVTFGGVIKVTDAIGGVEVCLARGIRDRNTGLDLAAGTHTVSGVTALQFLRTRYGVGDGSDLGRISNQQQYMSRLARKLVSEEVLSDPARLYKLAAVALDNVTPTRPLANPFTVVQIALAVKDVPFEEIVFVQYPALEAPYDPNRLVPDHEAAEVLWEALATNSPLVLTGEVGANGGVVEVTEPPSAVATPGATPSATPEATPCRMAPSSCRRHHRIDSAPGDLQRRQRPLTASPFAAASRRTAPRLASGRARRRSDGPLRRGSVRGQRVVVAEATATRRFTSPPGPPGPAGSVRPGSTCRRRRSRARSSTSRREPRARSRRS